MESEKVKEGDPFPPATHEFNETVDFAPARKPQNGTEFITMSHISEEVSTEKEISISEDLTLLFVVEEEIWGRLSSSVQKESSMELEKNQLDPDSWPEPSGVRNLSIQKARDTSSHGYLEEHAAVSSLSSHQSSLVNAATQAQVPSSLSEIAARHGEAQALTVGFSQTLNPEEQDEEIILTKSVLAQKASVSHDISKHPQNVKTFDTESDVDHSWERKAQQEMDKEILECVQPMWDIEVHPHKEGVGQRESNFPTKNEEQKVRDLKGERDDDKSSASHQSSSVSFEDSGINADITQMQPDRILSLFSSKRTENHMDMGEMGEEQGGNSSSLVLHFLAKEEDGVGKSRTLSSQEITRSRSAESHIDCDESEADQKDLLKKVLLESTETEALESGDSRWLGEQEILDCKGTGNKMEENDTLGWEHDGQEDQEWDTHKKTTSREKVQKNRATPPVTMDLETFPNVENNSDPPDLNQNNSLAKTEGFSISLEHVWTSSHCLKPMSGLPESCVQETARTPAASLHSNPKMLPPACSDSRQLESLGTYNHAACTSHSGHNGEQPIEEDRDGSFETELSEKLTKAINQQHENADKGTSDSIVGNIMLCQESDPLHEMPNQNLPVSCQLDLVAHDEASAMDRDIAVQDSSKKATISEEFHENVQDSSSRNLQSVFLGEELPDIAQETGEMSHVSSWTTQDSVFFQEEDTGINYLQNSQHLKAPVGNFGFPGKDAGADTPCMEQQISVNESVVLGTNETEGGHNTDSPASLSASFAIATDVTQLTSLLNSGSESNSTHFDQTLLPASDCRQPVELLTHVSALAHTTTAPFLHPRSPSLHEEQLSSPNQISQFLAPIDSSSHSSASMPDAGVLEQSTVSECDLNQYYHLPESVLSSDESLSLEYDANQTVPMPIVSKNLIPHSMSTTPDASQPIQIVQLDKSNQSRECIAESNKRLPNEVPTDISSPSTSFSSPPSPDMNPFAQHSIGAPAPVHCTEDDGQLPARMPIDNLASQTVPAVYESNSLSQLHNIDNKKEESCVEELAKSEDTAAPQGQEDRNTPQTCRDLRFHFLGKSSDLTTSGNEMAAEYAFPNSPEIMSKGMDMFDGKASYHLEEGQKSCKATELRNSRETPSLLAFTNPIHFLRPGPPSPPTKRWPQRQQAVSEEPQWWQASAEIDAEDMAGSMVSQQVVKDPGSLRMELEKSGMEPLPSVVLRKNKGAKHLPLEKSSSCPSKNISGSDTRGSVSNSKKQEEERMKQRAKSKDWHRLGVRKVSVPTDSILEEIAPLVTSKEDTFAQKDKIEHFDRVKYGERKTAATVENLTRRRSKLINSSRLLYQEYSDVALNKAIQSQKRDSLSEDVEPGSSPNSPRLRRKVLSPQESYLQRLSVSSSASLWQDIPMVRGSTMLLSMTREEQKLQEAKFELIASEASYLRSLNIAVDHFQHSQELQAVLSNQDRQWLFSRLQDVRDVSANFLFDLEEKLEENMFTFNVCDVALRHAPEFHRVYLPYVTNQTYQEQTFKRLMNGVPAFQQVLEKLESDPVCQRLSLKSFLILPFQRITRLKLLLQNILKRTRPGAEEEIQATQAYDALEKLIKDCNENVQRMKSTEELINLSKNMEFECKIFPLISQSRRLVKHGELTALEYNPSLKWKLTTRSIFLHLFNDYLLLSRPRENGRFIVFDYAASSDVRGEKCEMKLHGTNKNVFRLFLLRNNQGKKVEFLFRTETQSEKLRWISALSPQQTELDLLDDSDAPQVQCVKSYKSRENDELALEKADIVMVLRQSSDGWIEGVRLSDGERGWFPSDHVEFISSKHIRQMNLKEEQRVKNAKQQVFRRK